MTTSPMNDERELTPEQAIREDAWQQALHLYRRWEQAEWSGSGGAGGGGYRDPHERALAVQLRTQLDQLVHDHGFYGTRVDVLGLNYFDRRAASWQCPAERTELPAHRCPDCFGAGGGCTTCNGSGLSGLPRVTA